MFEKILKRGAPAEAKSRVTLSMKVIRRDEDGNVLNIEDHGVISQDVTGHVVATEHGPLIKIPRWVNLALLGAIFVLALLMGEAAGVIPAAVILTNVGEEWLVDKIGETVQTMPQFVDWGTGAGTAAKADTTLFTAAPEARVTATYSKVGTGAAAVAQYVATLTSAAGATITNVGFWTASSGGSLIIHADHAGTVLAASDQIQYTLTIDPS